MDFEVLTSVPDDPDTGKFPDKPYVKLEIPSNVEGVRRFLQGKAVKETFTGDVVMEDAVEIATNTVVDYHGTVKVPHSSIIQCIYPKNPLKRPHPD